MTETLLSCVEVHIPYGRMQTLGKQQHNCPSPMYKKNLSLIIESYGILYNISIRKDQPCVHKLSCEQAWPAYDRSNCLRRCENVKYFTLRSGQSDRVSISPENMVLIQTGDGGGDTMTVTRITARFQFCGTVLS